MSGFRRIIAIVASAAVCAGTSEISRNIIGKTKLNSYSVPTIGALSGDVFADGRVDASEASLHLSEYSLLSTGETSTFTSEQAAAADVNSDGKIDSIDASLVLAYYSRISTGGYITIEEYIETDTADY